MNTKSSSGLNGKKAAGLKFIRNQILSNNEYHHKATRVFLMSLVSLVETPEKTLVATLVSLVETFIESSS